MLKDYQKRVVGEIERFFSHLDTTREKFEGMGDLPSELGGYMALAFTGEYGKYADRPQTGVGLSYPRVCIKMPTGGGKTLIAIETIRAFQNLFAKRRTGLVVWITHRDQIYRQTIEHLQDKGHVYRQLLDQSSGNRTLIVEKGQMLRKQDVEENLVVLMLMIQSATKDTNKIFEDSGGFTDFFPPENRYDLHKELLGVIPNLDKTEDTLFERIQVKTSLGNVIRSMNPLMIVDEFHTMFTDTAKATLDGLNPAVIIGLSATPRNGMNILSEVSGKNLKTEGMIKLDMHIIPPARRDDWRSMLNAIKVKREALEQTAGKFEQNKGVHIRPIALIQVERTGKDQRGHGFVHSEDVREYLIASGVPAHTIAVKSSSLDEIKQQKLLSKTSEIRYIITKEALKEGWDCSFAYILGVIPNAQSNASMTQLVGRILRQPYAKKTGVAELDESYVFFRSGGVNEILKKVRAGFDDEGLGDLKLGISVRDRNGKTVNPPRAVRIRKEIREKYPESLFLPVWLVKQQRGVNRKFAYETDIRSCLSWNMQTEIPQLVGDLAVVLGRKRRTPQERLVNLSKTAEIGKRIKDTATVRFDTLYLARRLFETIENAFIAHEVAEEIVARLRSRFSSEALDRDAGYIACEIERCLREYRGKQEKVIFEELIRSDSLELVVSDESDKGFEMPDMDSVAGNTAPYTLNLYEAIESDSLNTLEQRVADLIEESTNVVWWARNKPQKGWYAVQGWQRGKIRPDFVIARKNDRGELEFVYVVESKGEHLTGNEDTKYKASVFEKMNAMRGNIQKTQLRTTTVKLNDQFKFEVIPEGKEEARLRKTL